MAASAIGVMPLAAKTSIAFSKSASVVGTLISDPGNLGTILRSAEAAGAAAIVLGPGSVDAYNPKVVRASAGACFAVRIVEGRAAVEILEALGAQGVARLGATESLNVAMAATVLCFESARQRRARGSAQ